MAAFQQCLPDLQALGVSMWVVSTDDEAGSADLVAQTGFSAPVGHSLPMVATAERLGLFYEERRHILHAASFLFDRDGRIEVAVTSTGAVGRLMPDELLRLIRYWREQRQPTQRSDP